MRVGVTDLQANSCNFLWSIQCGMAGTLAELFVCQTGHGKEICLASLCGDDWQIVFYLQKKGIFCVEMHRNFV